MRFLLNLRFCLTLPPWRKSQVHCELEICVRGGGFGKISSSDLSTPRRLARRSTPVDGPCGRLRSTAAGIRSGASGGDLQLPPNTGVARFSLDYVVTRMVARGARITVVASRTEGFLVASKAGSFRGTEGSQPPSRTSETRRGACYQTSIGARPLFLHTCEGRRNGPRC